jgi:Zn-dependent M32 family carboxypeptidase
MPFAAVHESGYGTFETSTDVRYTAAFGGNADNQPVIAGQSRFMSTRRLLKKSSMAAQ